MTAPLEQALLQSMHDSPGDDTPWLVLADLLQEEDDVRGTLLRLQLQLRGEMDDDERRGVERRARHLLGRGGARPVAATLENALGMRLALIRPGFFWMGSSRGETARYPDEDPRHRVEITRPFYLGVHTVTQEQYRRVMRQNTSWFSADGGGVESVRGLDTSNFPVENVTWFEAVAFCERLSSLPAEKEAGRTYRLPTEAEWEYACRAGVSSLAPFHFGHSLSARHANFDGTHPYGRAQPGPYLQRPCPVGSYKPNAFGLYDMHGNIWEWCQDWLDVEYFATSPTSDPPGPPTGTSRVLRGGSYYYIGSSCRSAIRFGRRPDQRSNLDGFRVVMVPRPVPS